MRLEKLDWALAVLAIAFLVGVFSSEIADTDSWWHLKTGELVVREASLPLPDIYSFTTELGAESYSGEERVRRFNLTHEWLAQAVWYLVYLASGFAGLVLWKGLLLASVLGASGYVAWRRSGALPVAVFCVLLSVPLLTLFSADRPTIVTFVMVATYVVLLEKFDTSGERRLLWPIPLLQLVWANSHGGFFMGWAVLGAYCLAAMGWSLPKRNALWATSLGAFLVSGLNPNGFRIFEILLGYRESYLTQTLIEWSRPPLLGPPFSFPLLLFGTAGLMLVSWRRVKLQDAVLLIAFGGAAIAAFRNLAFVAFFAPIFFATYGWPLLSSRVAALPRIAAQAVAGVLLLTLIGYYGTAGRLFQLRVADWKTPTGAAEFLSKISNEMRMFNAYEYGGFLIWALGPERQTFIDGRALNESVYRDYQIILASPDRTTRERLLRKYDVQVVVANSFEFVTGVLYPLVEQLSNPTETGWELVFRDAQALVFVRSDPKNQAIIEAHRLDKTEAFAQWTSACEVYVYNDPELCNCARTLGFMFGRLGQPEHARRFLEIYLANTPFDDPEAARAVETLR